MAEKLPTIKEIAKALKVSVSTVSRALKNHPGIGLRTRTRVQEMAKQLNYEPNQTALFFQQRKTFTIGVILPEISEGFFSAAINGIESVAEKQNYTVLLGQSHDQPEREKKITQTMKNHRVDGMIVSISKKTTDYAHFESLKKYNIPVVFFDCIPAMEGIHYVVCNMISGTLEAIKFLFKKGHRVIGMINGPEKLIASQDRKQGYIRAMTSSRLKFDPNLIVNSDLSRKSTFAAMDELLASKRKPTAIVTFNDYVALDAVQYAIKQKREINKDLSFVSYANLPINNYTMYPPLASVEQFPNQQGQKATEILLELLAKGGQETHESYRIILDSQLVVHINET